MAEHFALHEVFWNGCTVQRHKGASLRSLASCIAFATSSLPARWPRDQDVAVGGRNLLDNTEDFEHRGSSPIKLGNIGLATLDVRLHQAPRIGLAKAREEARSSSSVTGFRREIKRAQSHDFNGFRDTSASEMTTAVRVRPCSSASCRRSRPEPPPISISTKVRPLAAVRGITPHQARMQLDAVAHRHQDLTCRLQIRDVFIAKEMMRHKSSFRNQPLQLRSTLPRLRSDTNKFARIIDGACRFRYIAQCAMISPTSSLVRRK